MASMKQLLLVVLGCLALVKAAESWHRIIHRGILPFNQQHPSNARIIGGQEASPGQFPYQIGMYLDGKSFCGGSLISDTVVMTAAHCVKGFSTWDVHVGATNISDESEPTHRVIHSEVGIFHENYQPLLLFNDIALVKLPESAAGPNVETILLPSYTQIDDDFAGIRARASGWGKVSDASTVKNDMLKFVDVTVISNDDCYQYFPVSPGQVCIDTEGGTQGVCNGDSGGPLTVVDNDNQLIEIGIASFVSNEGCEANTPAGFTRVSAHLQWISDNANITIRP